MTVMNNALLRQVTEITNSPSATVGNITENGGQLGIGPHLPTIDAATPLVLPPVVPVITHIPTMFKKFDKVPEILKQLIERHTKSISGIDFGYEIDQGSGFVLPDGQEAQVPTKTKRTAISPSFTFPEIKGNLVWNLHRFWLSLMCDSDTHHSKLAAVLNSDEIDPFVFSYFSMDIMFIMFDVTMLPNNIIDAFFVTTMWPKNTGMLGAQKEVGTTQVPERAIDYTGIVQHNKNTYNAGVAIAELLNLHKANFDLATPIASTIEEESTSMGIQKEIEDIVNDFNLTP